MSAERDGRADTEDESDARVLGLSLDDAAGLCDCEGEGRELALGGVEALKALETLEVASIVGEPRSEADFAAVTDAGGDTLPAGETDAHEETENEGTRESEGRLD